MAEIPVGTKGEFTTLVTKDIAVNFLGMEDARVLSTPHMIGMMEKTCRDTVLPLLDAGYDTVGTHVNVAHLAAAPLGSRVTFRVEVIGVDGPAARISRPGGHQTGDARRGHTSANHHQCCKIRRPAGCQEIALRLRTPRSRKAGGNPAAEFYDPFC